MIAYLNTYLTAWSSKSRSVHAPADGPDARLITLRRARGSLTVAPCCHATTRLRASIASLVIKQSYFHSSHATPRSSLRFPAPITVRSPAFNPGDHTFHAGERSPRQRESRRRRGASRSTGSVSGVGYRGTEEKRRKKGGKERKKGGKRGKATGCTRGLCLSREQERAARERERERAEVNRAASYRGFLAGAAACCGAAARARRPPSGLYALRWIFPPVYL